MAMSCEKEKFKQSQNGNVLFLILIAVVLFAALSYAVTHSSQMGVGSTDDETGNISAAQINQFPNFVRAQVLRMMMHRIDITELEFNPPSAFGTLTSTEVGVFHPQFGTTYVTASKNLMANDAQGPWFFNMNFEVDALGTSSAGSLAGNDLMAFLPGVKANVCQRIDELIGLSTIPSISNAAYATDAAENMDTAYVLPSTEHNIGATDLTELSGEPFGCYLETNTGQYIYYFAIFER